MKFSPIAFENTTQNNILFTTSSLIGYYDITSYNSNNNIWYDLSGNGNDAQVTGSALALLQNGGLDFNGTNNWVTFPSFSGSAALTLIVWGNLQQNINRNNPQKRMILFNKRIATNNGFSSELTQRLTTTRDMLSWIGQSGVATSNQGFTGQGTGSLQFVGFQSTESTSSIIYGGFANALSSSWSGSGTNGWIAGTQTTGSVLFPYNQPLIFGSGSDFIGAAGIPVATPTSSLFDGAVAIIAVYNTMLTNDEMNTNYLAVSASTLY